MSELIDKIKLSLQGFELLSDASPFGDIFRWRAVVVVAGIYSFFLIERVLSFIFQRKEV